MRAKYVLPIVVLAAAVIAAFVVAGCGSDRVTRPNIPPTSKYPKLLNPYAVLDALRTAYQDRDTNEIKVLYHDQYDGSSIDQTDPSPALVHFTKADEVAHVSALARASVTNISIATAPNLTRFDDAADPVGWTTIANPLSSIQISDATSTRVVDVAHETMEFKFIPTPVPSSATRDTTWKIIRWTEVRNP